MSFLDFLICLNIDTIYIVLVPTDELTLQYAWDLSRNEARVYALKTEGYSSSEIADMMGLSLQTVRNTMHSANLKRKREIMHIVTIQQDDPTRKAIADMGLKILATDTDNKNLCVGRFSEILFDVKAELGNTDFIVKEVFTKIDPIVHNELESDRKAKEIYTMYLQLGGRKGQMGYGWLVWLFNKFRVKYEIY